MGRKPSANSHADKDVRKFLKACEKAGCVITMSGSSHFRVRLPTGDSITCAGSPRDGHHTVDNMKRDMRRYGWDGWKETL